MSAIKLSARAKSIVNDHFSRKTKIEKGLVTTTMYDPDIFHQLSQYYPIVEDDLVSPGMPCGDMHDEYANYKSTLDTIIESNTIYGFSEQNLICSLTTTSRGKTISNRKRKRAKDGSK